MAVRLNLMSFQMRKSISCDGFLHVANGRARAIHFSSRHDFVADSRYPSNDNGRYNDGMEDRRSRYTSNGPRRSSDRFPSRFPYARGSLHIMHHASNHCHDCAFKRRKVSHHMVIMMGNISTVSTPSEWLYCQAEGTLRSFCCSRVSSQQIKKMTLLLRK